MTTTREGPTILEWQHMTGEAIDAVDRRRAVVVVTCSPLEVHGPHLPTVTDNLEAEGLATRTLERLAEAHPELIFLRLPPIYVAADVLPHVGSIAFRSSTITRVLTDLGRSLSAQGFPNVWVASFHGGPRHFVPIELACRRVNRRHGGRMISLFSLLVARLTRGSNDLAGVLGHLPGLRREDLEGDAHGGLIETSMMLHLLGEHVADGWDRLARSTVDVVRAREGKPPSPSMADAGFLDVLRSLKDKLRYYEATTYAGAPAGASAELGAQILDTPAGHAAEALSELWTGRITPDECHSPLWRARWVFTFEPVGWLFEKAIGYRSRVW